MDKSLAQITDECKTWVAVSSAIINLGQGALELRGYCLRHGWDDTAEAAEAFARKIAECIEVHVIPAVDAHHVEHRAARDEFVALEALLNETQ